MACGWARVPSRRACGPGRGRVAAGHGGEPPGAAGAGRADAPEAQEHPPGEAARGGTQPLVGGDGEVGEQRGRLLRVAGQQRVERCRVERAHLR
ncbi:hypothetical protein BJF90_09630 [Pseudonocardia sp. CNS-004]|nr:hypothetical protein BJF90_09630 [Pseudonocardia sp. CNS-004]